MAGALRKQLLPRPVRPILWPTVPRQDDLLPGDASLDRRARGAWLARNAVALGAVAVELLVHLPLIERYGYHRDEYYFIDCGRHLALGYVDHAPLVPWIARLSGVLGYPLWLLRLPAVLACAGAVWLTILVVRRLGGGRFAEAVAAVTMLIAPAYLRMGIMLNIVAFEPLLWTAASLLLLQILDGAGARRWLWVGVLAGVGLMTKHSMLLWGAGTVVGLLATEHRRQLRSGWAWGAAAIALGLFAPNLLWQIEHGWATVVFLQNMRDTTLASVTRLLFVLGQLLYQHPLAALVWIPGWVHLYRSKNGRPLAIGFGVMAALLLLTRAKPYYLSAAYPPLLAAGAVAWEGWLARRGQARRGPLLLAAFTLLAAPLAVLSLPILSLPRTDRAFQAMLGAVVPPDALTHDLHDMYGWREQAEGVATVYRGLSPEQQAHSAILVSNYGQASSLNFHGPALGLPRAYSGNMTHALWGPPEGVEWLIVYDLGPRNLGRVCREPEERAVLDHPLANRWERHLTVYLCRPAAPLGELWPELRRYSHGPARALPGGTSPANRR